MRLAKKISCITKTLLALSPAILVCASAHADFGDAYDQDMVRPMGTPARKSTGPSVSQQLAMQQRDVVMQSQIQKVAQYMEAWCLRNSRFPEGNDQIQDTQAQLGLLVQTNPYNVPYIQIPGANLGMGVVADQPEVMQGDNSPTYGQYVVSEEDSARDVTADPHRVRLYRDDSLTLNSINYYVQYPPTDWEAPPGTITVVGNNSGRIMVWGAGANGRPLKDTLTGRILIISASWVVGAPQDSSSPNEDQ